MMPLLNIILLLIIVYFGYVVGVILGLISPEEMGFFKKLILNVPFILALLPIAIFITILFFIEYILLTSCICFFVGCILGSKEVSAFVVNNEIKKLSSVLKNSFLKSISYIIIALILVCYYSIYVL